MRPAISAAGNDLNQGAKAQGHGVGGDGIAEQIGQRQQGCAGLVGLELAADLRGGLIEHGSHLGLLLRRSLRLKQRQGLGDVCRAKHWHLEVLKLLVDVVSLEAPATAWRRASPVDSHCTQVTGSLSAIRWRRRPGATAPAIATSSRPPPRKRLIRAAATAGVSTAAS